MQAILYDCRDTGRGCTLRIFDGERMIVQAWLHGPDPIHLANTIAGSFDAEFRIVGPQPRPTTPAPTPLLTLDTPAPYHVPGQPPSTPPPRPANPKKPQPLLF